MKESDVIRLKEDVPKYGLKKGEVGTIVAPIKLELGGVLVEFVEKETGKTKKIVSVPIKSLEVIEI